MSSLFKSSAFVVTTHRNKIFLSVLMGPTLTQILLLYAGEVCAIDVRETKPVFTLRAHSGPVTGLSLSPSIPGCLVTTSSDKILRVWDIRGNTPVQVGCNK